MCVPRIRRWLVAAAVLAVGVLIASDALAQGMGGGMGGGGMGGMPDPGSIFKDKKPKELVGLSLAASDKPVLDVRIEGNKLIPTSQILNEMQTRVGRPYDPELVQRDVRKLTSRTWFMAVDTDIDNRPEGFVVTIKVVERPTIRYIEYLGNDVGFLGTGGIRDKTLAKETGLKVGGSIDPYAVEDARRKIIDLYRRNGFNNTQVTILEGNKPTDKGVVFVINEGAAQKIWKVEFEGNEFVSDGRLRTQIESKKPMLYIFKGYVDREQIDGDVERLTAYYRSFGFFQAKVGRKLEYNEKGNWVTLRFVVHEGPRYEVRNVEHIGAKIFAEPSLMGGMTLPAGQKFEQAKMNNDLQWLKDLYGSQGYVFADIRAEPVFLEEPGKIDLVYHIDEGKQWKVGRIFVHIDGDNPHTRIQTALNRLSFRPGQIVDIREIHASERRLQASSLFLADPAAGQMPKITYKIRDLNENVASKDGDSFRGQSPDDVRPATANQSGGGQAQLYEIRPPAGYVPDQNAIDVLLDVESKAPPAAAAPPAPSPATQSANPYQKLVIRTQSPYQPPMSQPYAQAAAYPAPTPPPSQASYPVAQAGGAVAPAYAANAYTASTYGGQAVRATGPDSTPVGYNAQPVQPVQQAQYGQPQYTQAAPPNTMFAPPPVAAPPVAQQPITPIGQSVGPLPPPAAVSGPTYVVPGVPANPQLFPSGATEPWARTDDRAVDIFVDANEAQTGRLMLGVAVNSDAGLFGQILLDEQNFDWRRWPTSMEDVVSGRAWRGAGQRFRLEAMPGTQVQRYVASFQEPYLFDTPVSFGLSGSYYDRRFEDWTEQRLGGRVSLGYQWTADDVSAALAYRGESIKIYDGTNDGVSPPELAAAYGTNALHGFKLTIANDTRDSAFFPTSGHYAELGVEQVIGTFYYPRATLDLRQYGLIAERPDHSGRHVLSFSSQIGFTGSNTPIYDTFYSGGIQFPGFQFHSVTPIKDDVQIGGDFQWINSLEYLFPLTADDMLHGSLFLGFGTVEENVTLDWNRFRVSPGFGFRITIPAMGPAPIALNFAVPIADADTDRHELFSFTVGFTR
jgi:outer membrane protein insertion porin family